MESSASGALSTKGDTEETPSLNQVVVQQEAELYFWDKEKEEFHNHGIVEAQIVQRKGTYDFWLSAVSHGRNLLSHKIASSMNQRLSAKMFSLTWNQVTVTDPSDCSSWLFRFTAGQESYDAFVGKFAQSLWETLNQIPWSKAKVLDL